MANPVGPTDTETAAARPVLIVGGTVLVVVLVSFLIYTVGGTAGQDVFAGGRTANTAVPVAAGACGFGAPDDSYSVAVTSDPDPPRAEGATIRLTIRQGARAVTGAKVCVTAEMPTMQHPGLNLLAKEGSGGRYETVVKFGMGGSWVASVIVAEPGKPVVSLSVQIEVAQVEQE